jgi:hypothetical protein
MKTIRQISLVKGEQHFVFRYEVGQEQEMIDVFAAAAADPNSGLDWFDVAMLSYQMGRRLKLKLEKDSSQL